MIDSLGYLFYPAVFGMVFWMNNHIFTEENGFPKAAVLSIFECFAMFGSWLAGIRLGVFAALACCLGVGLFLAVAGMTAKRRASRRCAGLSGGILLAVWGGLYALIARAAL